MGLILVFAFLSLVLVASGLILIYISRRKGKIYGWYMIIAAVLLTIIAILLYSSGHYYYDHDQGIVYPTT